jgi:hypothetical protein
MVIFSTRNFLGLVKAVAGVAQFPASPNPELVVPRLQPQALFTKTEFPSAFNNMTNEV